MSDDREYTWKFVVLAMLASMLIIPASWWLATHPTINWTTFFIWLICVYGILAAALACNAIMELRRDTSTNWHAKVILFALSVYALWMRIGYLIAKYDRF